MQTKWKYILIVSSIAGFCGFSFLLFSAYYLFKGEAYRESVATVQAHPEVIERLGTPIEPSWLFSGNYFYSGIFVQYDISGPKASGRVFMVASKTGDNWTLDNAWVHVDGEYEPIAVVEAEPVVSSGGCNAPIDDYETPDYPTEETEPNPEV